MKAIIVDDEIQGGKLLEIMLKKVCPDINVIAIYSSSIEAGNEICKQQPDILFLDVEMPEMNGFQLLEKSRGCFTSVVFTTAHSHYTIQAIRASAFDYLLKPIDIGELKAVTDRLLNSQQKSKGSEIPQSMAKRLETLERILLKPDIHRLAVQSTEGYAMLDYNSIIRLEAESNYTHIYTPGKKYTVARLLRNFEEQLLAAGFIRVHSAHLVNLRHIEHYQRGDGGYLIMSDKSSVEVSRSRKKELLKILLGEE
ncbi:MAG: LytR/AlgR family response regulator transcription factor [Bacteroidota bacterium]|jgi:two-component system LytT family response regulator